MNEEQQALLDALAPSRLPPVPIAWTVWLSLAGSALLLLGLVLTFIALRHRTRCRRDRSAWRRAAVAELAVLRSGLPPAALDARATRDWLAAASSLTRRIALVDRAREQVAPLTGDAWLDHLRELGLSATLDEHELRLLGEASWQRCVHAPATSLERIVETLERTIRHIAARDRAAPTPVERAP